MKTAESRRETRGARLLRELERAYRSLSPEQQRSVSAVLREGWQRPCPSDPDLPWTDTAAAAL